MAGKKKENSDLTQREEIGKKKKDFLEYYEDLPIKQAAADHIGRDMDTIKRWEKSDDAFAEGVLWAKSEYARKHGKRRPDNLLPRLYEELKPLPQEVGVSGTLDHQH